METLTGGRLVARMLRKEGVATAFTLSGLHVAPIYAGCVDEGIRLVDTRHEQAAAHAADAWARLTRGAGVAIVTAGPGVTDAVTGVANAWAASVPARPPRRRGADLQPGARLAPGDAAGPALPGHHQVGGPGPLPRPRPELPREGVPGGARRAARGRSSSSCPGTCSRTAPTRRSPRRRSATGPTRGSPGDPAQVERGARAPRPRRAPGARGRLVGVVGRRRRRRSSGSPPRAAFRSS